MATLDHYAAALRYVHIQALLLAEDYSPNGVDGLKVALERHLDLLAESCDAFNGDDQHQACRDIHDPRCCRFSAKSPSHGAPPTRAR